jgi:DegV family protein with EDD domain
MSPVHIVTDSTADIPPELAADLGITVVPAYVQIGTRSYRDGIDLSREEFYAQLPTMEITPTTAVPPMEDFGTTFQRLRARADGVVAITVSGRLSGMYSVATMAARDVPGGQDIRVVDSGQTSMGLGLIVIAAARAAAMGARVEEIATLVEDIRPRVHVFAVLDTVEYLRRSGRVSWARAKAVEILRVKPVIGLTQGYVHQLGRVRTMHQAVERLVDLCKALGSLEQLAVLHTYSPLVDELRRRLAACHPIEELLTVVATTTIGAHVGPRGLGMAAVSVK